MNHFNTRTPPASARSAAEPTAASAENLDRTASAAHILAVDDDPEIREIMAVLLRGAGYRVDTAGDGGAAWGALCARPYDLLITDHLMPKLQGLDLLRRVRAVPLTLPCILISGEIPWLARDLPALLQPGAALEKPFSLRELCDKVRELLLPGSPAEPPVEFRDGTQVSLCAI